MVSIPSNIPRSSWGLAPVKNYNLTSSSILSLLMSVVMQSQALITLRTLSHIRLVQSTRSLARCTAYSCWRQTYWCIIQCDNPSAGDNHYVPWQGMVCTGFETVVSGFLLVFWFGPTHPQTKQNTSPFKCTSKYTLPVTKGLQYFYTVIYTWSNTTGLLLQEQKKHKVLGRNCYSSCSSYKLKTEWNVQ